MIKVGEKDWDKLKDDEKIAYCESLLEDSKNARKSKDLEWYLNYMFEDGNHYLTYNTTASSIELNPPQKRGEVRMVVNKVRSAKRAIQNYVTAQKAKWEVVPGDLDEDTIVNARENGKILDYIFRRLKLESMISGVIDTGLSTSVGWVELDWDKDAERGLGQVRVRLHDPFDIWLDKRSYLYAGRVVGKFIAKTISKSLDEVKNDKRYDKKGRENVKEDNELAVSSMKAKIIRKESGPDADVIKRVTVKEFMLWDEGKNEKKGRIQLFTYAGSEVLRDEPMKETEYPLYCFQISMNPLKIYQRSWIADAIPLNKALDRTLSQKLMYVNQALVYRIITEKGHGAGFMSNEMGEFIEINKGRNFQQMQMNALPYGFDSLSNEIATHIEDVLGAHDASFGRMPTGARSGKTLEAIQAADSNNLTGLIQSMESFLSVVGEKLLEIVADNYIVSRIVKLSEPEDGQEYMRVIGEKGGRKSDATVINRDNEVIVKIGSWLGFTKEAQRDTIKELAQMGILPAEEVLRQFEFPNVEELSEKARAQRLEQGQMDLAIAGHAQGQGAQGGEQEAGGIDMQGLADKENMAMMNGEQLPPTEGADMTHTQTHVDFMKSQMFSQVDPQIQQIFQMHVQGEAQAQGVASQ